MRRSHSFLPSRFTSKENPNSRHYAPLAAILIGGGVAIGMYLSDSFVLGGYFTAAVLLAFALLAWFTWDERKAPKGPRSG